MSNKAALVYSSVISFLVSFILIAWFGLKVQDGINDPWVWLMLVGSITNFSVGVCTATARHNWPTESSTE
jgi:hypothetical protein